MTLKTCLFFGGASNLIAMARRGPNTPPGKACPERATGAVEGAASSRNAIKHGLTANAPVVRQVESVEDWERHSSRS